MCCFKKGIQRGRTMLQHSYTNIPRTSRRDASQIHPKVKGYKILHSFNLAKQLNHQGHSNVTKE